MSALADLSVVEWGEGVSAPFCARLFADFGAQVTKLESPDGDPASRWDVPAGALSGAFFSFLNGGKTRVRLTGDAAADGAHARAATAQADLFITNLPPALHAARGLDLAALRAANPALVTVSLGVFGASSGWADRRGGGLHACAAGGVSVILGEPGRPPLHFPFEVPALQAGFHGAAAALTALLARRRTGCGQAVATAEDDVLAFYAGGMSLFILGGGGAWKRRGFDRHGAIYPSGFYPCRDGFVFLATQSRAQWTGFLRLMGDPAWAQSDPALLDGVAIGWKRAEEVDLHFIPWLTQFDRRELVQMAKAAGLVLGAINDVSDTLDDPHLVERGFWSAQSVGDHTVRLPMLGYRLSATPAHLGALTAIKPAPPAVAGSPRAAVVRAGVLPRPLAGYRAIEFGFNWAGPLVGQILADMGMEVIKVETSGRLDFMRHWPHAHRFFHNANRGKLSVTIDVKRPAGLALVRQLIGHADLLLDNFAAGVMTRIGLGWETLRAVKPDLIALSMAMAGQTGPLSHLRGFATMATGFAGLETAIGYADSGCTGLPVLGLGDVNAAIQGTVACLAALWHRERTGSGQYIDLSQIEAATTLMAEPLFRVQRTPGATVPPNGNRHPHYAPHGIYPAVGDDRWVAIAVERDEDWAALVRVMGTPEWACAEALATVAGRRQHEDAIDRALAAWTGSRERDAIVGDLMRAGVPVAPVAELEEIQSRAYEVESFAGGLAPVYPTPWKFTHTPGGIDRPSPRLGEHNEYVLSRLLGLSATDIAALGEALR